MSNIFEICRTLRKTWMENPRWPCKITSTHFVLLLRFLCSFPLNPACLCAAFCMMQLIPMTQIFYSASSWKKLVLLLWYAITNKWRSTKQHKHENSRR